MAKDKRKPVRPPAADPHLVRAGGSTHICKSRLARADQAEGESGVAKMQPGYTVYIVYIIYTA
jgi:hypothetical protein